jgi:hypothetical protein
VTTDCGQEPVRPPSGFDAILSFFDALSSFAILVGVASLAFAAWSYQRNRRATDIQGLTFDVGQNPVATVVNGAPATAEFKPSATATGPGVRFGARTAFWVDDKLMKASMWESSERGRFDLDSEPMTGEVTIPVDLAPQAWFGIAWDTVVGRGIRTEFVRVNLRTQKLQRWKWYRFVGLHRWWCEQSWLRVLGGGQRRQAGRWKAISGDTTPGWQFPT